MGSGKRAFVAAAVVMLPQLAGAEDMPTDPQTWFGLHAQVESDRLAGVSNFVEKIEGGMSDMFGAALPPGQGGCFNCRVNVVEQVSIPDGSSLIPDGSANIPDGADNIPNAHHMSVRHTLSRQEVAVLIGESPTETMGAMGRGMGEMQDQFETHSDQMLGEWAGIAGMLFGDVPDNAGVRSDIDNRSWEADERETPWLNPFRMFGAGSYMMQEASKSSARAEESLADSSNQAQAAFDKVRAGVQNAVLAGLEQVDGEPAMRIDMPVDDEGQGSAGASNMAFGAAAPGETNFVPQRASVWIRPGSYVMVKHRVEGIATDKGKTRDFFIENLRSDFRSVPGSDMYEPYRRTMRMGGTLDDEQKAQMEEARKQLEEFDRELASMSPQERQMVENMMGGQMDAIRSMANGGVFEYVEVIDEIIVNADLKAMFGSGRGFEPPAGNLLQRIQVDLTTLGYQPGNTDGVMDTMTTVAISQFQAEQGLAVTGEPSEQLASTLAAAVAGQGG